MKRKRFIFIFLIFLFSFMEINAQTAAVKKQPKNAVKYIKSDFPITELDHKSWKEANEISVGQYWSGETVPQERQFKTRILWSDTAVYVRFEANQHEPLVVSDKPNLLTKTRGLWDRDVCEIFLAPDRAEPRKYFEFEIAPNGEWIDLGIHQKPAERITDWDYASGMKSAARVEKNKVWMAIKIDWKAFQKRPAPGDVWLGNIYRCIGKDPTRGYLAWSPTETKEPAFHVPEKFGEFEFVK